MSINELDMKVKELRELRRMAEELQAEIDAAQDAIKAHMDSQGVDTLIGTDWKVTWKAVTTNHHKGAGKPIIAGPLHESKEESVEKDYIVAPERIIRKLDEAEQAAVAINGLMEDVIDPAFYGYRCCGLLDEWSEETGGDKGSAALRWMEERFDALYAACYAVNALSSQVVDILQMLPRAQEKEAAQNG